MLQAQPPPETPDISSGGKQLQKNTFPPPFSFNLPAFGGVPADFSTQGTGGCSQLCSLLAHRGSGHLSCLKGNQPLSHHLDLNHSSFPHSKVSLVPPGSWCSRNGVSLPAWDCYFCHTQQESRALLGLVTGLKQTAAQGLISNTLLFSSAI